MAKFCGKCGTVLDEATGLCPACDKEQLEASVFEEPVVEKVKYCIYCGNEIDNVTNTCLNPDCKLNAPVMAEPAEALSAKPAKKSQKGLTITISVLLAICLFFTMLFPMVIFTVRNSIEGKNVERFIDKIDAPDLLGGTQSADDGKIAYFYEVLEEDYDIVVTDRKLNKFMEESTVAEFIADKFADFSKDFSDGDAEIIIKKKELVELILDNRDVIGEIFYVSLTMDDVIDIADTIFNGDDYVVISMADMKYYTPALYYLLSIGFSYVTMIVFLVLSALIIFILIRNSLSQALSVIGIDFAILGGLTVFVAFMSTVLYPVWKAMTLNSWIGVLLGELISFNAVVFIIVLAIGVISFVTKALMKRFLK